MNELKKSQELREEIKRTVKALARAKFESMGILIFFLAFFFMLFYFGVGGENRHIERMKELEVRKIEAQVKLGLTTH